MVNACPRRYLTFVKVWTECGYDHLDRCIYISNFARSVILFSGVPFIRLLQSFQMSSFTEYCTFYRTPTATVSTKFFARLCSSIALDRVGMLAALRKHLLGTFAARQKFHIGDVG